MENSQRQLSDALKSTVNPLLIALRNDLKDVAEGLRRLEAKRGPDIQRVEVANPQPFPETIKLAGEPLVKKVEVTNPPTEMKVSGFNAFSAWLSGTFKQLSGEVVALGSLITTELARLRQGTFSVRVENPTVPPAIQDVRVNDTVPVTGNVRILNSDARDAVPVRLSNGRDFYEALGSAVHYATEINLKPVIDLLADIATKTGHIDLDADVINLNTDEIEEKLDDIISALSTLNATDFATEAKQDVANGHLATLSGTVNDDKVKIQAGDSPSIDAFSRWRTSEPVGLFDSTFQYDLQPALYYQTTANGGTIAHAPLVVSAKLSTVAQANSSAILQSKTYHRYIPAKSQLIVMTQIFGSAVAGVTRRAGYYDDANGVFLEQNGTTDLAIVRRTSTSGSVVNNRIVQANWNLDTLDGNGPSGITLDLSKASILVIDLQWLGMGRVRFGFDINGHIIYVHELLHANVLTVPYMQTANLPVRWGISGNGVADFYATCASVISEGGAESERGFPFAAENTAAITAGNGTLTHLISIRPAATLNGIVNRVQIALEEYGALVTGNNPVRIELLYGTTVTGGSWVSGGTGSACEYNINATSFSGGVRISAEFIPSSATSRGAVAQQIASRLPLTLDPAGANPIVLTLAGAGLGAGSDTYGVMRWRELR